MMRWLVMLVVAWIGLVSAPAAQTPEPILSYSVEVWADGVDHTDPTVSPVLPANLFVLGTQPPQVVCGLTPKIPPYDPTTAGMLVSPSRARFDDPADPANADCEINVSVIVGGLMDGRYFVTAQGNGATLSSARVVAIPPFDVVTVTAPLAPTGVRMLP